LSTMDPAAFGGKLAFASVAPLCRSPCFWVSPGVHRRDFCFHLKPRSQNGIPNVTSPEITPLPSCRRDKPPSLVRHSTNRLHPRRSSEVACGEEIPDHPQRLLQWCHGCCSDIFVPRGHLWCPNRLLVSVGRTCFN
jgi:hypothetical protein